MRMGLWLDPLPNHRRRVLVYCAVIAVGVALDLLSKIAVLRWGTPWADGPQPLVFVSWDRPTGMKAAESFALAPLLLVGLPPLLTWHSRRIGNVGWQSNVALGMVAAGALGNALSHMIWNGKVPNIMGAFAIAANVADGEIVLGFAAFAVFLLAAVLADPRRLRQRQTLA